MAHPGGRPRASLPFTPRRLKHITATLVAIAAGISISPVAGHLSARPSGEDSSSLLLNAQARPVSLAAADFDADGVPDLLAGYATADGGMLVLHRGNVDALYPNTPEARGRRLAGQFTSSPFLPAARAFPLPTAPDFLQTGDFDADGHFDAIAAAAGGAAMVLRGDGAGALGPAEPIALPGVVTALAVGDINGPDGLADVVVGVTADTGSRLLVFAGYDGAWRSTPSVIDLPAPATALALGHMDTHAADVAAAAGNELLVIHGRERRPRTSRLQASAPPVERQSLPFAIQAMRSGDYTGNRRTDLAAIAADGAIHVVRNGTAADLIVVNRSSGPAPVAGGREHRMTANAAADAVAVLPMRLDLDAHDDLVVLRPGEVAPTFVTTLAATTRVVTNTDDSGPGSLRQAILDSNGSAGDDLIAFDIPGPGPHTITLATPLPVVRAVPPDNLGAVIIDGTTEPDYAGTPIVELSGALLGGNGFGLVIGSDASAVRGLVINRFAAGIVFTYEFGGTANGGLVEGNYIGTDVTGTTALGNGAGVLLGTGAQTGISTNVTVGGTAAPARNLISGNGRGIDVLGGGHFIQGNFIGTDATGGLPLGNSGVALSLISTASIEVGGLQPGAGNIISANGGSGFTFFETGPVLIAGNFIGTDVSGERALGNGGHGIEALDSGMTIAGNVISANTGYGIFSPSSLASLDVLDNRIGTNSAGTTALGNGLSGLEMIGFSRTVSGNVISGNGAHGIRLGGLQNLFQQNRIGTDITGTIALGNGGDGVQVLDLDNRIGGDGLGNTIAFNGGRGIAIDLPFPTFVPILSNAIHSNGGLGIDLGADGLTPNDPCDADEHANFPVLTSVTSSPSGTSITGQLNSRPNASHFLQFFASAEPDPSGFGEGAGLLGSATVTTDSTCNAAFTITLPVPIPANYVVTATSTITTNPEFAQMATSEFSNALRFVPQTSEATIQALIAQVRDLVAQGQLNGFAGFVLTIKLQAALFFVERDLPRVAAVQLRGFIQIVELLVKVRQLDPAHGQALVDAARAIIAGLEGT